MLSTCISRRPATHFGIIALERITRTLDVDISIGILRQLESVAALVLGWRRLKQVVDVLIVHLRIRDEESILQANEGELSRPLLMLT